jgi:hypothetical protein
MNEFLHQRGVNGMPSPPTARDPIVRWQEMVQSLCMTDTALQSWEAPMNPTARRTLARSLLALMLALVAALAGVSVALAAPTEPTMGLAALDAKLAAAPNGRVPGYFKTVLKGANVEAIPCEIVGVVSGNPGGSGYSGSLIMFEASGPQIDRIGGVASGMSGSPVYVNDGGVDKLVGAVSYGDIFALHNAGLATPIEAMAQVETYGDTVLKSLRTPVVTSDGIKFNVVITPDRDAYPEAPAGTIVAHPLTTVFIGGLDPSSAAFKLLKTTAEKNGATVLSGSDSVMHRDFSAPFVPGGSVAAMATRGDLWWGGVGTVTYVNGQNVIAFGHPMTMQGPSYLYLSNAWVESVWPSAISAYKLAAPGAARGTLTQDRAAAVMGVTGALPAETLITARAVDTASGHSASSSVRVPRKVVSNSSPYFDYIAQAASAVGPSRLFDGFGIAGSAVTTTTIVFRAGDSTFTVARRNMFDTPGEGAYLSSLYGSDLPLECTRDVGRLLFDVQRYNLNGPGGIEVVSVDLQAALSSARKATEIKSVDAPDGLRIGENHIVVTLVDLRSTATRGVDVTLTIPEGTDLRTGTLRASAAAAAAEGGWGGDPGAAMSYIDTRTPSDLAADMQNSSANDVLQVSYFAAGAPSEDEGEDAASGSGAAAETTAALGMRVVGISSKSATLLTAALGETVVPYQGYAVVRGTVSAFEAATVELWVRQTGETTETLADSTAVDDMGAFTLVAGPLTRNAELRVRFIGNDTMLPAQESLSAYVSAKVRLSTSKSKVRTGRAVTLTAKLLPGDASGRITFQRRSGHHWKTLKTVTATDGRAQIRVKLPRGTSKLRAYYWGGPTNAAGASNSIKVRVGYLTM